LKSKKFSLKILLEAEEVWNLTDSLQLQIITASYIVIATTHNEEIEEETYKRSVKVMKVKVAKMLGDLQHGPISD
jgi:hypothetical protein